MSFNLSCLVLLEGRVVQLRAGEKVSIGFHEVLKGPQGLLGYGTVFVSSQFSPELMTLIYLNRSVSRHRACV